MPRPSIPEDKINLRLILVSGKTKDYLFRPSDSAGEIAQYVFDNWPIDWNEEAVSSAEILRMIYQGRFLHGNVTLAALGYPQEKPQSCTSCQEKACQSQFRKMTKVRKRVGRVAVARAQFSRMNLLIHFTLVSSPLHHQHQFTYSPHQQPRSDTERQNLQLFYGFRILLHYKNSFISSGGSSGVIAVKQKKTTETQLLSTQQAAIEKIETS